MSTAVENRYLVGNFAPVSDELSATNLPVHGAIPAEFLRKSPCAESRAVSSVRSPPS